MSKFANMLSADSSATLGNRAKNLADSAVLEVESFIANLRKEKLQLNSKLNDLTDLAPENTYSLRPGSADFNPAKWVRELHQTRMDIALKEIELAEAQAIYDEWFAETPKAKK
jgi:hypothetical protein